MYQLIKQILFKCDPEKTHQSFIRLGKFLGNYSVTKKAVSYLWSYDHPSLHTTVGGIHFKNPVGLAAGFDKNAELHSILSSVGFGFVELGSVTGEECAGNAKPRLFRLPEQKSILVNYGLCNIGAVKMRQRLAGASFDMPIGISVAKTNRSDLTDKQAMDDYAKAFELLCPLGSYTTINVSCPSSRDGNTNTYGNPENLPRLLQRLDGCVYLNKPVFLKIKPDYSLQEMDRILKTAWPYRWVTGFIMGNLRKDRTGLSIRKSLTHYALQAA